MDLKWFLGLKVPKGDQFGDGQIRLGSIIFTRRILYELPDNSVAVIIDGDGGVILENMMEFSILCFTFVKVKDGVVVEIME